MSPFLFFFLNGISSRPGRAPVLFPPRPGAQWVRAGREDPIGRVYNGARSAEKKGKQKKTEEEKRRIDPLSSFVSTSFSLSLLLSLLQTLAPTNKRTNTKPHSPFVAAFTAFAIAQTLKVFTFYCLEGRWDLSRLVGSGGMPSSHTGAVAALAAALGAVAGTSSPEFAIAVVVAGVVMYDASGVRLHAGRQASVLNVILTELPPEHPASDHRPLRDTLGHTPLQVLAGAALGALVGFAVGAAYR